MASTKRSNSKNGDERKKNKNTAPGNIQLEKLFIDSLNDLYWAEKQLLKALPKMKKAATTIELQVALEAHWLQTEEHSGRLEEVFALLEKRSQAKKCDAMEGLIKEGEKVVAETKTGSMTRDAGIIISSQKIEHYEIAAYGGLTQIATTLELNEIADILLTTLEEEKQADLILASIAESNINWETEQEDKNEE